MVVQSYLLKSQANSISTQFGAMTHKDLWRRKSLLMLDYPNMWNSRSKTLNKLQLMQWRWFHMWNIGRIFYYICQSHCLSKVPLFWKAFGLRAIGSINMPRLHCHQQWRLWIWKTQSCIFIVDLRIKNLLWHTPCLKISTMEILFSWGRMIFYLSLCGWEEHKVMLSKMTKMKISKWWRCNGGLQRRKGQI